METLDDWVKEFCKTYKIPREFMFTKDGNRKNIEHDKRFDSFIEKLKTCIEADIEKVIIDNFFEFGIKTQKDLIA